MNEDITKMSISRKKFLTLLSVTALVAFVIGFIAGLYAPKYFFVLTGHVWKPQFGQTEKHGSSDMDPDSTTQTMCKTVQVYANSVNYVTVIPQTNGTLTIDTLDGNLDTVIELYRSFTPLNCNDDASGATAGQSSMDTKVTKGTQYKYRVGVKQGMQQPDSSHPIVSKVYLH